MSACTHFSKIRLLGSDPRLYQCTTADGYVPPADGRWWGKDRPRCWGDGGAPPPRPAGAESERHELVRYDRMGEWRRAKEYQS